MAKIAYKTSASILQHTNFCSDTIWRYAIYILMQITADSDFQNKFNIIIFNIFGILYI